MNDLVTWLVRGTLAHGAESALRMLMNEMVAGTQAGEPGTLCYQWFIDPERRECHILERYVDSAAAAKHLETFDRLYATRFEALVHVDSLSVYGDPGSKVVEALQGPATMFFSSYGGFAR